jgi:hypothetical protein
MPKKEETTTVSIKSIALGIVIGICVTAVVVSIISLFAVNDFNRNVRFALDRVKNTLFSTNLNNFTYPHQSEIDGFQPNGWKPDSIPELGISMSYPQRWVITKMGSVSCDSAAPASCLKVSISDPQNAAPAMAIFSKDTTDFTKSADFPVVINLAGKKVVVSLYRNDDCLSLGNGKCIPDPAGSEKFLKIDLEQFGSKAQLYIYGTPNLEEAVFLNKLVFNQH